MRFMLWVVTAKRMESKTMKVRARSFRGAPIAGVLAIATAAGPVAQPEVVRGFERQIGPTPGFLEKVFPPDFVPLVIPELPPLVGDTALARILELGLIVSPPEVDAFEERLHRVIFPAIEIDGFDGASDFDKVDKVWSTASSAGRAASRRPCARPTAPSPGSPPTECCRSPAWAATTTFTASSRCTSGSECQQRVLEVALKAAACPTSLFRQR